jgi:hypothetical protein
MASGGADIYLRRIKIEAAVYIIPISRSPYLRPATNSCSNKVHLFEFGSESDIYLTKEYLKPRSSAFDDYALPVMPQRCP